ncbi:MAG: periplasmic heavy metal sensor [Verrucomicrobia bacterium]|nr:MAG: periplasmic heavy metal sensor [Verrucomicrobiota bacterium]
MTHETEKVMKTTTQKSRLQTLLIAAAVFSAATMVWAQPDSNARPERRAQPQDGAPGGARPQGRFQERLQAIAPGTGAFAVMRVLTEEQRESMRTAMQAQREKMQPIEEQMRAARKELAVAGLTGKFDEDAVREKALKVAKLEAELTVLRAKALSQIQPPLSAEQIEQIKNPPPMEMGQGRAQGRPENGNGNPDQPRRQYRPNDGGNDAPRGQRPPGNRDENDLPPKPKADL